jgi:hypothetical protein
VTIPSNFWGDENVTPAIRAQADQLDKESDELWTTLFAYYYQFTRAARDGNVEAAAAAHTTFTETVVDKMNDARLAVATLAAGCEMLRGALVSLHGGEEEMHEAIQHGVPRIHSGRIYDDAPACPRCGHVMDGYTELHGNKANPRTGDFSICYNCLALNVFEVGQITLRPATAEEEERTKDDEDMTKARRMIALARSAGSAFVCEPCKDGEHCNDPGNWCDCQCRKR